MAESIQHKLDRVRPPRVQITYDVEIGGAIIMKELPYVVGIMADLSGNPVEPLPPLKERKFVEIDRDNFNDVLAKCAPRLTSQVDNKLAGEDEEASKLNIELVFKDIDDFSPVNVLKQIEPLKKLYEARVKLRDLLTKLDGNDQLDALLREVIESTDEQAELKKQLEAAAAESGDEGDDKPKKGK